MNNNQGLLACLIRLLLLTRWLFVADCDMDDEDADDGNDIASAWKRARRPTVFSFVSLLVFVVVSDGSSASYTWRRSCPSGSFFFSSADMARREGVTCWNVLICN